MTVIRELFETALDSGAEIIAFPEHFFLFPKDKTSFIKQAKEESEMLKETLIEWATEYQVGIIGGTIPTFDSPLGEETSDEDNPKSAAKSPKSKSSSKPTSKSVEKPHSAKPYNETFFITPDGEVGAQYQKIHLFDQGKHPESDYFQPGSKPAIAELESEEDKTKLGFATCYDLRFPELFRYYYHQNVEIFALPSAFTQKTGRAHWDILTRARAVENQAYVIAPNLWGDVDSELTLHGHTRIIDPWGRVIAERPSGDGVIWADLDITALRHLRAEFKLKPRIDASKQFRLAQDSTHQPQKAHDKPKKK